MRVTIRETKKEEFYFWKVFQTILFLVKKNPFLSEDAIKQAKLMLSLVGRARYKKSRGPIC